MKQLSLFAYMALFAVSIVASHCGYKLFVRFYVEPVVREVVHEESRFLKGSKP